MKALKIILVTVLILGVVIYLVLRYTFRTTSEDIAHLKPFSEIMGKELRTIQPSFIAVNNKSWQKENPYVITMNPNKLSGNVENFSELPLGSILKIKGAKRYTSGVTGFKSTYVLGYVFLEDQKEEVEFEFAWGGKNYGTDLKGDYFSYRLAPWQDKPLEVMYNYEQGIEVPYENYNTEKENRKDKQPSNR